MKELVCGSRSAPAVLLLLVLTGLCLPARGQHQNNYLPWKHYVTLQKGMAWPLGQAIPQLASLADTLDGIDMVECNLSASEKTIYAVLQGLVNRTKPRIYLYYRKQEGKHKWPDNLHLKIREFPAGRKWTLLKKYRHDVKGVILYSTTKSAAYLNLATTIAGLKSALPVTRSDYDDLLAKGIRFPILEDLTKLPYATPAEIYQYLYDTYWKYCTKRLLVSLSTHLPADIRDIGVAAKTAFLWLDPRKEEEKKVLDEFLGDMKAGQGLIIGWWPEERSGVGTGTSYGISTIAADFYENASIYAGMSHIIKLPEVPKMPGLQNKIYIAIFLSDGDNIQYCQHALSKLWDNKSRGIIPINWTVSPGLVDMGPGLLNYYYSTATPNDFFASGPSGLGYALIYDALNKKWNMTRPSDIGAYTKFTQQYIEKAGLRVITIWDEVNAQQMDAYATNCRYLYGATLEDWQRGDPLSTIVKQDKLAFIPNLPCYASNIQDIYHMWEKQIKAFDGSKPLFLAAQGVSWKMGPQQIVQLKHELEARSPGNVVICRGDHFFSLYNEAHHLDFNLTLLPEMQITSSQTSTRPIYAADGTPSGKYKWVSAGAGAKWIQFDFKNVYLMDRYVVRHAGSDGMDPSRNTRSFKLEASTDKVTWKLVDVQKNNVDDVSDVDFPPVKARYIRLLIINPGKDGVARIGDVEIYGKRMDP